VVSNRASAYPLPPDYLRVGVGAGDYYKVGEETVALLKQYARLGPSDRVLDVGCGLGRIAWPLARELGPNGSYDGIDTAALYIDWCSENLPLDPQRVNFHWLDVYNSVYNPFGTLRGERLAFPFPDNTFTLSIATSLFTHLSPAGTTNYLREMARTLQRGGRIFASFYVLDNESREVISKMETFPSFTEVIDVGRLAAADSPDEAIAFDVDWLHQAFLSAGYALDAYIQGRWRQDVESKAVLYQDLVVGHKT
jgi:ubiquinone/menaquinone biosynthesis C-methylase UbiE